jgi:hypothetical protein
MDVRILGRTRSGLYNSLRNLDGVVKVTLEANDLRNEAWCVYNQNEVTSDKPHPVFSKLLGAGYKEHSQGYLQKDGTFIRTFLLREKHRH